MSINSQKQTYLQSVEWLKWFNKKYNRSSKIAARLNNPNKHNN